MTTIRMLDQQECAALTNELIDVMVAKIIVVQPDVSDSEIAHNLYRLAAELFIACKAVQ